MGIQLDTGSANREADGKPNRGQLSVYRIFLASPGDVRDERELARAVIEQIRAERALARCDVFTDTSPVPRY
jgi:hypothetical protein